MNPLEQERNQIVQELAQLAVNLWEAQDSSRKMTMRVEMLRERIIQITQQLQQQPTTQGEATPVDAP